MRIMKASYQILTPIDRMAILKHIEACGRECYQSDHMITEDSAPSFIEKIKARKHGSVLEHFSISVKFINDRGVSHEEVRHRIASFSQESTRYCNYANDRFDNEIAVISIENGMKIDPKMSKLSSDRLQAILNVWQEAMDHAQTFYNSMVLLGATPQIARSVLPNSLKTSIVITANLREWILILGQRTPIEAHPQMREVMIPLGHELAELLPEIFGEFAKEEACV